MAKPKAAELVRVIHETKGNISTVADSFGVARKTVYDWIQSTPSAQVALADARERLVDTAVSKLSEAVEEGQLNAIFYTLNNSPQAKAQGWGPKQEITHDGGARIVIEYADNQNHTP